MAKEFKTFEGDMYLEDKKVWTNISNRTKNKEDRAHYLKGMIRNDIATTTGMDPRYVSPQQIGNEYNLLMQNSFYNNIVLSKDLPQNKIQFTNGYLDMDKAEIVYSPDIEFTPYQIPVKIFKDMQPHWDKDVIRLVDKFLDGVSTGEADMKQGLLEIIGSTMAPVNDSIFPIFYSPHKSSGKGTIMDLIANLNQKTREIKGRNWWGKGNQFALSPSRNQLAVWIDEVPAALPEESTELIKSAADSKRFMEIERKGVDQEKVLNTPTYMATTNHSVEFYSIDDSLKGRVIWYEFQMNAYGTPEFTKSEISTIISHPDALEYVAHLAMKAYIEVLNRPGTRNERFTKSIKHNEFWNTVTTMNKAKEIIEASEVLSALWDNKENFISNEDLSEGLRRYKDSNPSERITLKGLQSELISYLHSNKIGTAVRSTFNNKRGIKITWASKAVKSITTQATIMEQEAAYQALLEKESNNG